VKGLKQTLRRSSVRWALMIATGSTGFNVACGDEAPPGDPGLSGGSAPYPSGGSAGVPVAAPPGSMCTSESACRGRALPRCAESMLTTCDTERARWECVYRRKVAPGCMCYAGEVRVCPRGGATGAGGSAPRGGTTGAGGGTPRGGSSGAGGAGATGGRDFQVCVATGGTDTKWGPCE